jgi:hypothetical protein
MSYFSSFTGCSGCCFTGTGSGDGHDLCFGCDFLALQYSLTFSGILDTPGVCDCVSVMNTTFVLTYNPVASNLSCTWDTPALPFCHFNDLFWQLTLTGQPSLKGTFNGGVIIVIYTLAPGFAWDCVSPLTLNYASQSSACQNWPLTATVDPV